ncbi:hypothetical protein [Streptomyces javensis]|uniref:hypothetical protein n=1 Tax=Streptomyces javensis TaxID=114698 RepID=UPI0031F9274E
MSSTERRMPPHHSTPAYAAARSAPWPPTARDSLANALEDLTRVLGGAIRTL